MPWANTSTDSIPAWPSLNTSGGPPSPIATLDSSVPVPPGSSFGGACPQPPVVSFGSASLLQVQQQPQFVPSSVAAVSEDAAPQQFREAYASQETIFNPSARIGSVSALSGIEAASPSFAAVPGHGVSFFQGGIPQTQSLEAFNQHPLQSSTAPVMPPSGISIFQMPTTQDMGDGRLLQQPFSGRSMSGRSIRLSTATADTGGSAQTASTPITPPLPTRPTRAIPPARVAATKKKASPAPKPPSGPKTASTARKAAASSGLSAAPVSSAAHVVYPGAAAQLDLVPKTRPSADIPSVYMQPDTSSALTQSSVRSGPLSARLMPHPDASGVHPAEMATAMPEQSGHLPMSSRMTSEPRSPASFPDYSGVSQASTPVKDGDEQVSLVWKRPGVAVVTSEPPDSAPLSAAAFFASGPNVPAAPPYIPAATSASVVSEAPPSFTAFASEPYIPAAPPPMEPVASEYYVPAASMTAMTDTQTVVSLSSARPVAPAMSSASVASVSGTAARAAAPMVSAASCPPLITASTRSVAPSASAASAAPLSPGAFRITTPVMTTARQAPVYSSSPPVAHVRPSSFVTSPDQLGATKSVSPHVALAPARVLEAKQDPSSQLDVEALRLRHSWLCEMQQQLDQRLGSLERIAEVAAVEEPSMLRRHDDEPPMDHTGQPFVHRFVAQPVGADFYVSRSRAAWREAQMELFEDDAEHTAPLVRWLAGLPSLKAVRARHGQSLVRVA